MEPYQSPQQPTRLSSAVPTGVGVIGAALTMLAAAATVMRCLRASAAGPHNPGQRLRASTASDHGTRHGTIIETHSSSPGRSGAVAAGLIMRLRARPGAPTGHHHRRTTARTDPDNDCARTRTGHHRRRGARTDPDNDCARTRTGNHRRSTTARTDPDNDCARTRTGPNHRRGARTDPDNDCARTRTGNHRRGARTDPDNHRSTTARAGASTDDHCARAGASTDDHCARAGASTDDHCARAGASTDDDCA